MRGWTEFEVDRAKERISSRGKEAIHIPAPRRVKVEPKSLAEIKEVLRFLKIPFQTEYQFLKDRKFRFDIAIPEKMIAIEYEGLISERSRHTTISGYSNDCVKYNLAVINGWRVLRYTTLTSKNFKEDITKILFKRQEI